MKKRKTEEQHWMLASDNLRRLLKQVRERKQLSLRDLARECGVGYSTIWRIEEGELKDHSGRTLDRLTKWLRANSSSDEMQAILREADLQNRISLDGAGRIPYFESVVAGPLSIVSNDPSDLWDLNDTLIRRKLDTYLLRVQGDSMVDALIFEDDVLVVERTDPADVPNGAIVIAEVNGECCVKKYFKESERIVLQSANQDYADIFVTPNDGFRILGRVTHTIRKLLPK